VLSKHTPFKKGGIKDKELRLYQSLKSAELKPKYRGTAVFLKKRE
jgi:hypothetical protein